MSGSHTRSLNNQRRPRLESGRPTDNLKTLWEGSGYLASNLNSQKQTLTLTLSQRERGLTEVFGRPAPTWNTELNANMQKIKSPSP
jgi:hypothetical protein